MYKEICSNSIEMVTRVSHDYLMTIIFIVCDYLFIPSIFMVNGNTRVLKKNRDVESYIFRKGKEKIDIK